MRAFSNIVAYEPAGNANETRTSTSEGFSRSGLGTLITRPSGITHALLENDLKYLLRRPRILKSAKASPLSERTLSISQATSRRQGDNLAATVGISRPTSNSAPARRAGPVPSCPPSNGAPASRLAGPVSSCPRSNTAQASLPTKLAPACCRSAPQLTCTGNR